jgi:hypothetical protein
MTDWRRITLTQSFDDPGHRGDYYLVTVHAFSHEIKPKGKWILIDNNAHGMTPFTSLKKLRGYAREHQMQVKRSPTDPHCYYVTSWQYVPGNR